MAVHDFPNSEHAVTAFYGFSRLNFSLFRFFSSLHQQMKDPSALLLRFTSLLLEVMILKESSPQLVTKLLGTEEYEKENNRSAIS